MESLKKKKNKKQFCFPLYTSKVLKELKKKKEGRGEKSNYEK